jgi:RNA polymerase sigma factor (sigma-70 family)
MDALCPLVLSRNNSSPSAYPAPLASSEEETRFIQDWDSDVKRSARWNAKLAYLTDSEEDDLAQEARIRLVRLFRGRKVLAPNYLRVVIKNSMLTSRSRIQGRCNLFRKEVHENGVVISAREGIVQYDDSSLHAPPIESGESQDEPDIDSESWTGTIRRASEHQIAAGPDFLDIFAVRRWVRQLPDSLRRVYEALYVDAVTQREAAIQLGVSQPRIAQFHRQLLQRAKQELGYLAA